MGAQIAAAQTREVRIGLLTQQGIDKESAAWAATTEYLDRAIDGYSFRLVPFTSPDALSDAAQRGQLEFAITSPSSLVQLEVRQGARALLDLVGRWQDKPLTRMGGVLFTSATRKDINVVRDMAGKTLMAVSNNSFGGWLTIKGELLEQDFDPIHDLSRLIFAGGSPKDVVRAVLNGKADVGAVRTGVLERMAAAGEISMSDVKIIRSHPKEGFPLAHSTDLYPEWKLAVMAGTDPALARDVAGALLQIAPESPMAKRGGYFHWTLPTGEQSVHLLMQHLRVPPYEDFGKITLAGLIQAYWGWLFALAGTIAGLLVLAIYALRKNALLRQRTNELCTIHETELGFQRRALDEHLIVSVADAEGRIIYVNDKFIEISGYERDELIGQTHALLKSGHHSPEFYRDMWDTLKQGKAWTGEIRNRRKDGSHYWVKATIMPFLGRDGKIEKYVSLRTDITDVKEAEIQRQLAASFDFIEDEVYMFDPDTLQFFYVNRAAQRQMGLSEEEICKLTPVDTTVEMTEERFREIIRPITSGETDSISYVTEHHRPNGQVGTASIVIQLVRPENEKPRFVAVIRNISDQVEAERQMTEIYNTLDLLPVSVTMIDPVSLRFVYQNQAAKKRFGWSDATYRTKTPLEALSGFDEDNYRAMIAPLLTGKTSHVQYELVDANGHPVEVTLHIVKPGTDEARIITIAQDISEQRRSEERIHELEFTLDYLEHEVYMFWPDSKRFFYANKAALRRNGLTEDEILYLTPTDLKDGLTNEECRSILAPMMRGEMTTATFERDFQKEDGSWTAAEITLQYIQPEGHPPRFVATIKDISDKRAAQDEAKLLSQSLDLIQDEIYLFWPDSYDFVYLNESAAARAESMGANWRGHSVDQLISETQFAALKKRCEALLRGPERSFSYELVDRNKRTIEVYLHLVRPKGAKPRFLAIYRDITERKIAEKAKSEFISTVSHELRTPLTSIKGALGLMEAGAGGELPAKATKLVSLANTNCDRLVLLVNDLLDLDKLSSGKIELKMEPLHLADLVKEAIEANHGYGEQFGVRFVAKHLAEDVMIRGDRSRLRQVLDNLMSNAAKFSKQGDRVELSVIGKDDAAVISVKDYGSGIPEEARERIFERFTQADSSDQRQKGGTGLGLNIAKSIVELHHGKISFISQEGEGTEFFVELPIMVAKEMEEQDDERRTG